MKYLVYLHSIGLSQKDLFRIFGEQGGDYRHFYENISFDMLGRYIKKSSKIENILNKKHTLDTQKIEKTLHDFDVKIICFHDKEYPKLLKNISSPPYFLYVRGEINGGDNFLSVVGSRKISDYARKVGEFLLPELSRFFTIVSGGAGGCDTLAHKIALENNQKTIVVFGTGIDQIYPISNKKLFENIVAQKGALISIFPLGTLGSKYSFPMRNEVVSGMSRGVVLLQAGEKSGTLITAQLALEQSRDVFAVPGDIFSSQNQGGNYLIQKSGAKLIQTPQDILEEYHFNTSKNTLKEISFSSGIEEEIYNLLKYNISLSVDDLLEKGDFEYSQLVYFLSIMEISGYIKKDVSGKYRI